MKLKLITLFLFIGIYANSQKNEESKFKQGVLLHLAYENFDDAVDDEFRSPGISVGLKYFGEIELNNSNFITVGGGLNYTSVTEIEDRFIFEQITHPDFNFYISQSEFFYDFQFLSLDLDLKYQLFPFKKLPLMLTVGVKPQFLLSKKSNLDYKIMDFRSADFFLDDSDELVSNTEFLDREVELSTNSTIFYFGFLGYRNERFKIDTVMEASIWKRKDGINPKVHLPRVVVALNLYYFLW